jgi:N-acetyl-anhydromuramyl-L-alanine amidase AmpD
VEHRCTPVEVQALKRFNPKAENRREMAKSVPDRYPANQDSIGIEIVGAFRVPKGKDAGEYGVYEAVNQKQNDSLRWLVQELAVTFSIPKTEVFRHPVAAFKNRTEATSAAW